MRLAADADVVDALSQVGPLTAAAVGPGRVEVDVDDRQVTFEIRVVAYATGPRVRPLVERPQSDNLNRLLVADRITADARDVLDRAGWSYLDRRGHLRLRAPGVLVVTDIAASGASASEVTTGADPLAGAAGLAIAYRLLTIPDEPVTPTRSGTGFAPSTVSVALRRIRDAGLVETDGRPVLPELFWALAERWRPRRQWLLDRPDPAEAGSDPDIPGWCLTGSRAAAGLGAPIVSVGEQLDFYVPGPAAVTIALRRHGGASDPGLAAASIAVPPVEEVTNRPGERTAEGWPLAHTVAVALDLAQDQARGREILEDWSPDERVW